MAKFEKPLLFSDENPDGVYLEDILEQLLDEVRAKGRTEPSRETSLVATHLEVALMYQCRRGVVRGGMRVEGAPEKQCGHVYVPRLIAE